MLRIMLAVFALSGCSFALVSGPPANHRQLPIVDCTTSRVGPVLDTVWTVLQALNFGLAASSSEAEWNETFDGDPAMSRSTAIPVYAGLAALGAAGMYYGFTRTGACRRARSELAQRGPAGIPQPAPGPGTWPPPAPGPGTWPPPAPAAPEGGPGPAAAPDPSGLPGDL